MEYSCSFCGFISLNVDGFCTHIRLLHPHGYLSSYKCCFCPKEYSTLQVLKKHLITKHVQNRAPNIVHVDQNVFDNQNVLDNENEFDNQMIGNPDVNQGIENINGAPANQDMQPSPLEFKVAMYQSFLALAAKLYSDPSLNRTLVQEILKLTADFASSGFLDVLKSKALALVQNYAGPENDVTDLRLMFESLQNSLEGLTTERQRMNAFRLSNCYIDPRQFHIGQGEILKLINGARVRTPVELFGQYVSVPRVLKRFLELPGVFNATLDNMRQLKNSTKFTNIIQGPLWQNIERMFGDRLVLPLVFYFDDADPNNQMGSHSSDQSLGCLYYFIPCIPQHLLSQLDYIFVASLFHTDHQKNNIDATFRVVIDDLKKLETEGIEIVIDGVSHQIFFAVVLVVGDNKGVNGITGFTECFVANHYCRICREHRNVMHFQLRENPDALRNPDNYATDLLINDVSLTGIKTNCIWNELRSYHCTVNVALDLMHDFLTGVCHYDISIVLLHLISEGYFSIETLNERVQYFDLGLEPGNRPSLITMEHLRKSKLKMSASEMFCFARNLGLIIGDLVPEGNDYWRLYLKLVEILDIVTAPYVRRESIALLSTIIAEHHEIYCHLFGQTLKPKFHLITHCPRIMLLLGPLIYLWCMRLEGKHRPVVKIPAHSQPNRVNVPLTMATRYCLSLAAKFLGETSFPPSVVFNPEEIALQNHASFETFRPVVPVEHLNSVCCVSVKICGTTYKTGLVLAIGNYDDYPIFGTVETIVKPLEEGMCYFLLKGYTTVHYNEHMHAYEVQPNRIWHFTEYNQLLSFHPTSCRKGSDGVSYVTFRHGL